MNQRSRVVATARWSAREPVPPCWGLSAVTVSISSGAANQNTTDATARRATDAVTTAEIARHASRPARVARRSTKTGMKVAESTPPRTTS